MAVFCEKTGVRLISPTGNEVADWKAYKLKTGQRFPLSVECDPADGWEPMPQAKPAPEPKPEKTTAAPSVERAPKPAAKSAYDAPRKGKE